MTSASAAARRTPPRARLVATSFSLSLVAALLLGPLPAAAARSAHPPHRPARQHRRRRPVAHRARARTKNKRMSDVTGKCATLAGDAALDCISNALEQPGALYSSIEFLEKNAVFTVTVDGSDVPAKFESKALGRERRQETGSAPPGLVLVDAGRLDEPPLRRGQAWPGRSSTPWGTNDIVDVMLFNDKGRRSRLQVGGQQETARGRLRDARRRHPHLPVAGPHPAALALSSSRPSPTASRKLGNAEAEHHRAHAPGSLGGALQRLRRRRRQVCAPCSRPTSSRLLPRINNDNPNMGPGGDLFLRSLPTISGRPRVEGPCQHATQGAPPTSTRCFNKMHIVSVFCVAPTIQMSAIVFRTYPRRLQNVPVGIDLAGLRSSTTRRPPARRPHLFSAAPRKIMWATSAGGHLRAEIYMAVCCSCWPASWAAIPTRPRGAAHADRGRHAGQWSPWATAWSKSAQ